MNLIIEERTGIMIKTVDKTDRQILRLFLQSQFICLFPFFISDLVTIYTSFSLCLEANLGFALSLAYWIFIDGYVKLAIFLILLIVNILDT